MQEEEVKYEPEIILFGPQKGKQLKSLYPELAENPKFKNLNNEDLTFVWYFANQSSPIKGDLPDSIRAKVAVAEAEMKDADKKKKFIELEFNETMKAAIEEMKKYSPKTRALAMRILQTGFNNMYKMINVQVDDFKYKDDKGLEKMDWTARSQYINSVKNTSEMLPGMLAQMETGFGIVDKKTGKESEGEKTIDKFHQKT